jgi:hypothetical protein
VASAVTSGAAKPLLVSYNFYNSSWPLASTTVQKGTGAAIGFQDEIDDAIAELFFARLYESWQRSNWNLLVAYKEALKSLSEYAVKMRGTGIVLWSAASLLPYAQSSPSLTSPQTTSSPESLLTPSGPVWWVDGGGCYRNHIRKMKLEAISWTWMTAQTNFGGLFTY